MILILESHQSVKYYINVLLIFDKLIQKKNDYRGRIVFQIITNKREVP